MSTASYPLSGWNVELIDEQFTRWQKDPSSVSCEWQAFFSGYALGTGSVSMPRPEATAETGGVRPKISALVDDFRDLGHTVAHLNPLEPAPDVFSLFRLSDYGLSAADMGERFDASRIKGCGWLTLKEILAILKDTYCSTIGAEFMHDLVVEEREWLQERMESCRNRTEFTEEERRRLLYKLYQTERFEQFIHKNYNTHKRFSLEGCEGVIPMLDFLVEEAGARGVEQLCFGMAHRGRLNVMVNIMHRPAELVFTDFEDNHATTENYIFGDVKYHKGASLDYVTTKGHRIHLTLAPNPSHLEAVNPVVEGRVRAKGMLLADDAFIKVMPVLIHGDAALAGQGIVAETFNMSHLEGYRTGGTIHIVINNQVGFTTRPRDSRSTPYATDIAKMVQAPIFHVNAEDPEALVHVAKLAVEFRQKFGKDIVIDVIGYRKWGHNEGDEPTFTLPLMYEKIRAKKSVVELYTAYVKERQLVNFAEFERLAEEFERELVSDQELAQKQRVAFQREAFTQRWKGLQPKYSHAPANTSISPELASELAHTLCMLPSTFNANPKVRKVYEGRLQAVVKGEGIDWGNAEMLAFGALVKEGFRVRLSGQDSRRGTFSQRHATLYDMKTDEAYTPLRNLPGAANMFEVWDSPLSEEAVLGFEYGYSLVTPDTLVMWEAQFGDFTNGAQNIVDEFIASAEAKWDRHSGLVMLLPHGYEGQGPDHSSARPERFLQLCAEDNMQVVYPSTPAQYFHLLRRQLHRDFRKPLIVMTPKSLLRYSPSFSRLEELTNGRFQEVIGDSSVNGGARRVVVCTGKVYYDLLQRRDQLGRKDIAILRLEQIYPFPLDQLTTLAGPLRKAEEVFWVQEEPENMGAWTFVAPRLREVFGREVHYVGRAPAASPATGSPRMHKIEQEEILAEAIESGVGVPAGVR